MVYGRIFIFRNNFALYLMVLTFLCFILLKIACAFLTRFVIKILWVFYGKRWHRLACEGSHFVQLTQGLARFFIKGCCFFVIGTSGQSHLLGCTRIFSMPAILPTIFKKLWEKMLADQHGTEASADLVLMKGFCALYVWHVES